MDFGNKFLVGITLLLFVTIFLYGVVQGDALLKKCVENGFSEVVSIRDSKYCKEADRVVGVGCSGAIFMMQCGIGSEIESLQEVQGRIQ